MSPSAQMERHGKGAMQLLVGGNYFRKRCGWKRNLFEQIELEQIETL